MHRTSTWPGSLSCRSGRARAPLWYSIPQSLPGCIPYVDRVHTHKRSCQLCMDVCMNGVSVCVRTCLCERLVTAPARGQGVCPVGPGVPGRHCGAALPSPCPGVAPGAGVAPLVPVCCGSVVCVIVCVCVCCVRVSGRDTDTAHKSRHSCK